MGKFLEFIAALFPSTLCTWLITDEPECPRRRGIYLHEPPPECDENPAYGICRACNLS